MVHRSPQHSRALRPHRIQRITEMVGGRALIDRWLTPPTRLAEVVGHDRAALGVGRVQPTSDGLCREATIGERAHEQPFGTDYTRDVAEHLDGTDELVDRHAAHGGVE